MRELAYEKLQLAHFLGVVGTHSGMGPHPILAWRCRNFPHWRKKATESVTITLDAALLAIAGRFLDG